MRRVSRTSSVFPSSIPSDAVVIGRLGQQNVAPLDELSLCKGSTNSAALLALFMTIDSLGFTHVVAYGNDANGVEQIWHTTNREGL